jgi:hypothetical protein
MLISSYHDPDEKEYLEETGEELDFGTIIYNTIKIIEGYVNHIIL